MGSGGREYRRSCAADVTPRTVERISCAINPASDSIARTRSRAMSRPNAAGESGTAVDVESLMDPTYDGLPENETAERKPLRRFISHLRQEISGVSYRLSCRPSWQASTWLRLSWRSCRLSWPLP